MISRRGAIVRAMVAVALWTGCALGRLGSYAAGSPADYERPRGLPAAGGVETSTWAAPRALSGSEIEALWGELAAENPELADQSAGIEGVAQGWGWCPHHGNVRLPHDCSGGGSSGSGGGSGFNWGNLTVKDKLVVASSFVLMVFLIVDLRNM